MEILVNNLISKLSTDNPQLIKALYDKYSFKAPGYQYTPQYKRRVWDGNLHYFKQDGSFRTGLLHRVVKDLQKIGVKENIVSGDPILVDQWRGEVVGVENFEYRDYQKDAIQHCIEGKRCIIESPVGSGKTLIMAGLVASLAPRKMVLLFDEKAILNQTYNFFKKCGLKNLGVNSGEGYVYGDVMLTMVQSIDKILDTHLDEAEVLIVDEAHKFCKGEVTVAAIQAFPNAIWRVGFTATVPSEKENIHGRMNLEGAFGEVISTVSTDDLIKAGKLAKPIIQILDYSPSGIDPDISYPEAYEEHIVESNDRNAKIIKLVQHIYSTNKCPKILILVKNLNHLNKLKDSIENCYSVQGKDDLEERYLVINNFKKSFKPITIIGTNVMQTGISIDEITHMINARGLEGEIPTIQGLGRGIRKADGKDKMYFYDFLDNVPYLLEHSKKRIKHYKNYKFEINYVKF